MRIYVRPPAKDGDEFEVIIKDKYGKECYLIKLVSHTHMYINIYTIYMCVCVPTI